MSPLQLRSMQNSKVSIGAQLKTDSALVFSAKLTWHCAHCKIHSASVFSANLKHVACVHLAKAAIKLHLPKASIKQ